MTASLHTLTPAAEARVRAAVKRTRLRTELVEAAARASAAWSLDQVARGRASDELVKAMAVLQSRVARLTEAEAAYELLVRQPLPEDSR